MDFKKIKFNLLKTILKPFGNWQVFKYPFFLLVGDTHYQIKGPEQRVIIDKLKGGDILLRRYDKYLSGLLIPGYYTHAAFYKGSNKVIHALGDGVVSEDILTFLRCDAVAILRVSKEVSPKDVQTAMLNAKELLGEEYDWAFDYEDEESLSCTEFVAKCYEEVSDKTGIKTRDDNEPFGKTIIPDDFLGFKLIKIHDSREDRT
jgi:hypothetical protein